MLDISGKSKITHTWDILRPGYCCWAMMMNRGYHPFLGWNSSVPWFHGSSCPLPLQNALCVPGTTTGSPLGDCQEENVGEKHNFISFDEPSLQWIYNDYDYNDCITSIIVNHTAYLMEYSVNMVINQSFRDYGFIFTGWYPHVGGHIHMYIVIYIGTYSYSIQIILYMTVCLLYVHIYIRIYVHISMHKDAHTCVYI